MQIFETDWLKKWAHYTPEKLAFREHERDLKWTYREINQRVNVLCDFLSTELDLKKGDRLAVYSRNNAEYVFLFFACIKTGIILVPLNFRLMPGELDILLKDSDPAVILFEKEYYQKVQQLNIDSKTCQLKSLDLIFPFLTNHIEIKQTFAEPDHKENDVVMILYTAGTTGIPKGAMITHKMLFWNSVNTALRLDISSSDHTQSYAPFFHTGGWNVLLTPFIHHGASHTILNGFDAKLILQLMEKERSTLLFGVPTMMQMLSDSPYFQKVDLSTVRYAVVGGAPMSIPLINIWHKKGVFIRQGYGLTEVGPNCFSLHQDDAIRKKGSIGFPNFYIAARVVRPDSTDCSAHEVGELWLKSPVVTPGYWRKDDATAESITDGWFHTGDMVRFDEEGFYYVVDRKKNMYISGGENVYPAEVEQFLITIDGVKEAAVIGVLDEKWGEVGKAFIVCQRDLNMTAEKILNVCSGKLAKFKTPKYVIFVEDIPKNEAGKIDRVSLKNR